MSILSWLKSHSDKTRKYEPFYTHTFVYCPDCPEQGYENTPFTIRDADADFVDEYIEFCPFCGSRNIHWVPVDTFYELREKYGDDWIEQWLVKQREEHDKM